MSTLSRLFTSYTVASIDARIGELIAQRAELTAAADLADAKVPAEVLESGVSPSAKTAEERRREAASIDRAIAALESERRLVAEQEEQIRTAKAWRAANDFGRHLIHRAGVIEGLITQLRTAMEQVLADATRLKDMVPQLPEGFEHAVPLEAGLLAAVRDQLHGSNFRDRNPGVSPTAQVEERVNLMLRERPDEVRSGTQLLMRKPRPSDDATAKA